MIKTKLDETEFDVSDYRGKQLPLQERLDMVERDLQRERDNRDNIQADYNSLCQKVSFCSYCFVSCSFLLLEQSKHSKGSHI